MYALTCVSCGKLVEGHRFAEFKSEGRILIFCRSKECREVMESYKQIANKSMIIYYNPKVGSNTLN